MEEPIAFIDTTEALNELHRAFNKYSAEKKYDLDDITMAAFECVYNDLIDLMKYKSENERNNTIIEKLRDKLIEYEVKQ